MINGTWTMFRNYIAIETASMGIEKFRDFGAVKQTMRASYYQDNGDLVSNEVKDLLRKEALDEEDWFNLINQASHIALLNNVSNLKLDEINSIVEFGGGCGYMCHTLKALGFKGKYYIYDFPEIHNIQRYYLGSVGRLDDVFFIEQQPLVHNDLFIGMWSISESTPRHSLQDFPAEWYWIGYQPNFDGVDNGRYFNDELTNCTVFSTKHHAESKYLVGKLK